MPKVRGERAMAAMDSRPGPVITALRLSGTVVTRVLVRPEFWIFFIFHMSIFGMFRTGYLDTERFGMNWAYVKVIAAITTFFEVFYTNECYKRYLHLWTLSRTMFGAVYDIAFCARLYTRCTGKPYDRLASRWMVVSHLLHMREVRSGVRVQERDWTTLIMLGLASEDETRFLEPLSSEQRTLVMLHSVAELLVIGLTEAAAPPNVTKDVVRLLMTYRALQQRTADLMEFPIPYEYFHLLNLMITINLSFWAYGMALTKSFFAPCFFFFATLIFMGMLDLATQLSDPFGDDGVDFPLVDWTAAFLQDISVLLHYEHAGHMDGFKVELEDEAKSMEKWSLDTEYVGAFLDGTAPMRQTSGYGNSHSQREAARRAQKKSQWLLFSGVVADVDSQVQWNDQQPHNLRTMKSPAEQPGLKGYEQLHTGINAR